MAIDLDYWLQWQVPVCALIVIAPSVTAGVLINRRNRSISDALNSKDLWIPCWRKLHPGWLLLYRAVAFVSMALFLYQTVVSLGFLVFFFYTQWTFVLVMVYFALATFASARGCLSNSSITYSQPGERAKFLKKDSHEDDNDSATTSNYKEATDTSISQGHRSQAPADHTYNAFWENVMYYIFQACAGGVMLTDIVFWCLLLPFMSGENFKLTPLIAGMHSVNAFFLILDSALNSLAFPWFGLTYFIMWSCSYVVFQWGIHICGVKWWPYPFLELATPWAPLWYFALALVHLPCYAFYVYLIRGKEFIFSRIFPDAYFTRISTSSSWKNEKKQT